MSKLILLNSKKYPGYKVIVDDEDYNILIQYKWSPVNLIKSNTIYAHGCIQGKWWLLHRFIMQNHEYNIEKKDIDHEDGNGLNNQKENLRICTHIKNRQNSRKANQNSTSKYKGVCFKIRENKYEAYIILDQKFIHLGYYLDEKEAALAYNEKARALFGEFACLNIII